MGKKLTENTKAVAARARKAETKAEENVKKQKAKEDAKWVDEDKALQKKQQRKEEEERKRLEALQRKQELKAAYEEDMNKAAASKGKVQAPPKVTQAAIHAQKEAEKKAQEEEDRIRAAQAQKIEVPTAEIEENMNRLDLDALQARNVDEAIKALSSSGGAAAIDKHPEKRLRSAYTTFEETRLPQLKIDHPTFRLSQLRQILKKEWQKSPENPLNQRSLHMT
uniref:Coiled-coil domain-containing protein 124 n=1 Tax=Panagrolaimus sp. PS1159 TaxID=55785 RepID=A0AC35EYM2_9BILA